MKTLIVILASLTFFSVDHANAIGPAPIRSALSSLNRANGSLVNKEKRAITRSADCDYPEQLIDVKLTANHGSSQIKDDRTESNDPNAGFIYRGEFTNWGISTAILGGRRHMVTAAHSFAEGGIWDINLSSEKPTRDQFGQYWVYVQACGKQYQVADVVAQTLDHDNNIEDDYAVIEFTEDLCPEAQPPTFGTVEPSYFESSEISAVGYYKRSTVNNPSKSNPQVASKESSTRLQDTRPDLESFKQHQDTGNFVGTEVIGGQRIDHYQADQDSGGSGGPVMHRGVVVGMQFRHPTDISDNYNLSIAPTGKFLEFLKRNIPDLKVKDQGKSI